MAKYNSSPFGNISGEVLGVVASSNKGVKFLRNKGKTADAKTEKQLARRAIYGEFCTLWDSLEFRYFDSNTERLKEDLFGFKSFLSGCLKLNTSAVNMLVIPKWKKATLPAPQLWQYTDLKTIKNGVQMNIQVCFPSVTNSTDFYFIATRNGYNPYDDLSLGYRIDLTNNSLLNSRIITNSVTLGYSDMIDSQEMISYRMLAYMNKKTGQLSKPMILLANRNLEVSTIYPFGK